MNTSPLPPLDAPKDAKTEFFMTASHQLKSPVAIVQWCLQSILENKGLDADTKKLTERALDQANGMSLLLADMLRVFRIMHGQKTVETVAPVNVNKVLDEVIAQYAPVAEQHLVGLQVGPIEQLPPILADEIYVKQAIINLLDNAIKYTKSGGRVGLSATLTNGQVQITVQDQGIGIPDAEQGRLFSEFFRGELAKEKTENGTGLGLVLVKHIAERFGGSIHFTSTVNKGSSFVLSFPAGQQ